MIKIYPATSSALLVLALTACGKAPETAAPALPASPAAPAAASTPAAATTPAAPAPVPPANVAAAPAASAPAAAEPATAVAANAAHAAAPLVYPAPAAKAPAAVPANTRVANFAGLEADIPVSWKPVPPANSMRLAEFQAPTPGQLPAEAVVFYFPPGQGGPQDMNIARWASQFSDAKGAQVIPQVSKAIINNMAVTRIELSGNYARGVGMGTAENAGKPNQVLIAAIVTTPTQGNVTFHFFGPQASVKKQRESFEAVLKSIRFKG